MLIEIIIDKYTLGTDLNVLYLNVALCNSLGHSEYIITL